MTPTIKTILTLVEKFNESIIDALDSKNVTNTGEAARSLRVEYGEDFVQSLGVYYLEFLDTGRGSGKMPPFRPIANWVMTKLGISPSDARFNSVVFQIRRKIALLGTEIFLNNKEGIELSKKIVTLREEIKQELPKSVKTEVMQKLDKFKKIFESKNLRI